jgi:hypothetical protein
MPEAAAIRSAAYAACGLAEMRGETENLDAGDGWSAADGDERLPGESAALAAQLATEVAGSLAQAQHAVLAAARQTLCAYQRQQEARAVANSAENEWMIACFSSGREQTRAAGRTRRAALRSHEEAWHAYQAQAQQLCKAAAWLVQLEALANDAAVSRDNLTRERR